MLFCAYPWATQTYISRSLATPGNASFEALLPAPLLEAKQTYISRPLDPPGSEAMYRCTLSLPA